MRQTTVTEETWGDLVEMAEPEREVLMEARYRELAWLAEAERRRRLLATAQLEYTLPGSKLRVFHRSRLRTWLRLDPQAAQRLAASYEATMRLLPERLGSLRATVVKSVASYFSPHEQEHLRVLLPRVFGQAKATQPEDGALSSSS